MNMSMGMSIRQAVVMRCQACNEPCSSHAPECPVGILETLRQKAWHIECPKCLKGSSVDVNKQDWFECRLCHTQFTTSGATADSKSPEEVLLFDLIKNWHKSALVMVKKGTGKFSKDETIKRLEKRIAEINARKNSCE